MIAGAGLNNRAVVEHVVGGAPAAIARLAELGVPFNLDDDGDGWHLTHEGGHSHRRIVHVADATGWAIQQALESAAIANPNITILPDHVAIDFATGRHADEFSTSGAVHGIYAFNRVSGAGRDADRAGDGAGDRRGGAHLSLFDRAARGDRGRDRDGVARGMPHQQHGIHAIPPDLPVQSGGQEFPDHRGGARRRRDPEASRDRPSLHARLRRARRACAARYRGARDRRRDQARRAGLCPPRHQPQAGRVREGPLPQHLRETDRAGHRHHQRSRSRWCRRSIIPAAGCWSTWTAGPMRRASMPRAK